MILIADDNSNVRRMLRSLVEDVDSVIIECVNGQEAYEAFLLHEPDVVLMDIGMEPVDGLTAMRMILRQFPDARIIVISEHRESRIRELALDMGAARFIGKDDVTDVARIVASLIDRDRIR